MSARHRRAHELAAEEGPFVDQLRVDDPVAEDELVVVDVFEEQVEGGQPLDQPLLDVAPLVRPG